MIIGGMYVLDLECDKCGAEDHPTGDTKADTTRFARGYGWVINWQTWTAICPQCSGKKTASSAARQYTRTEASA